jgi:ferredoxin
MESDPPGRLLPSGSNPQPHPTMASISDRLPLNVAGRFFVDSSCIDCDQCRTEAPEFFARDGDNGTSYVMKQPVTPEEIAAVESAAANCATGSIGDETAG